MKGARRVKKVSKSSSTSSRMVRPALTPEAEESQMISLAVDLVKQRLLDGTASAAETTHYLKLASSKHRLEMEKMEEENKLLKAKTELIETQKSSDEFYKEVLRVMQEYAGRDVVDYEGQDL